MVYIGQTKSGEPRRVPMNSTLQKVLAELKTSQNTLSGGRVFLHDSRYLRRAFDRAVKAAGLSPFRFHELRHAFASRLAMSGCNDRGIMELGGWSSSPMLKRYVDISPAHLWQAVEGLTQNGNGSKTGSGLNVAVGVGSKLKKKLEREKGFEPSTLALARRQNMSKNNNLRLIPLQSLSRFIKDL